MSRKIFKLNDEFVGQLAKLVSLSLITGNENFVDHLRQLRLEEDNEKPNTLLLTEEYKEYYQKVVNKLTEEAEKLVKQMQENIVKSGD